MKANKSDTMKESKGFLMTIIGVMVIISMLTSYTTYLYLQGAGGISGRAGTEGSLNLGDLGTDVNVIIVESSDTRTVGSDTDYGVSGKTVSFTVSRGGSYLSDMVSTATNPYPFLIRNVGGDAADVKLSAGSVILTKGDSDIKFWVAQPTPVSGGIDGWNQVDNCPSADTCYNTTTLDYVVPKGEGTYYGGDGGSCLTGCISIKTTPGGTTPISNKIIIRGLKPDVLKNEAVLHVKVIVSSTEPSGTKTGTLTITGIAYTP